ncbi:ORF V: Enzymatic polyprotein [Labeo rohita]|uniref:ribonuclease H n=1 Tax=Labeo rohita TaxID=84645 RepID=A0ABQ8LPY8_LABRO|nr:ORF V: Enzymatic polyprotein [Labeo rohita]
MTRQRCCTSLWRRCPPKPPRRGGVNGYISGRFAIGNQISSPSATILRLRERSLLAVTSTCKRSDSAADSPPADAGCNASSPAAIRRFSRAKRANKALFQMPRRFCRACKAPLHAADNHGECVSCLGLPHAEAALKETDCPHCGDMSLSSLRSRIAFFSERDSAPSRPPVSFFTGACEEETAGEGSPVLFTRPDLCPSAAASDMVSFGGSEDDMLDSMSLAASDAEELSGSINDPAPLPSADTSDPRSKTGMDAELFRVLTRAVDELGLEWSPPEEPPRSLLDEWFLPGRRQAPRQRASPFLPEVHEELTRSRRAPYSARLRASSSSALTSVDGAEDKGYEKLPPLDESVAAHLCPPTAIGWKTKASHPSKPCRTTSALAGRAYTSAGQAASALHSMAILQVFQAKLLAQSDKSALDPATLTELRSATDLALRATKATAQAIGRSMASLVVLERHLWLTLTEIKDADKVPFLDAPISPTGLFGPSVEGFAERFSAAQKSSQAMQHFLPKRLSSTAASGRPKSAPPQQPVKPASTTPSAAAAAARPAKAEPRLRSRSARRYPFPKRERKRRGQSLALAGPPPKRPLLNLQAPRSMPGAEGGCLVPLRWPTARTNYTLGHSGRGLAGHPRSVRLGIGDSKKRLLTPVRSKAPAFQRRGPHRGDEQGRSRPALRGDDIAGKGRHRSGPSSPERLGVLQPLLPRPQEGWDSSTHSRFKTLESGPHETAVQDVNSEADPLARSLRGLVSLAGSERRILSHPDSPHHRRFLRFAFEGVAYQYTVLPFGLSLAPRTFTKCMDAALAPLRQRGIRILNYLDDWLVLAQSEEELLSHRTLLLSHLECLGLKVNLPKSMLHPSRKISFLGAIFDSTQLRAMVVPERALLIQQLAGSFRAGARFPLKRFQRMLGLMTSASPVLELGLLRMRPLQRWLKPRVPPHAWRHGRLHVNVDRACVKALAPWKDLQWYKRGVPLGLVCRRKVVTTDASNRGWGALCDGSPAFGLWSKAEDGFHINCLEMLAVCHALCAFLPDLKGHHVLVRSDSMTVVSYINRQGGLSSRLLFTLVKDLLEWAQCNLASLRAVHVPGKLNQGADMLSRSNVPSGEWMLHPQTVQKIWEVFGKAEVDLFASKDNSHCPIYFSKERDALAHDWPNLLLYAFPPTSLIPQILKRVREQRHKLLLVAPLWRTQPWFPELCQLLCAAPWPIPLRRDLLHLVFHPWKKSELLDKGRSPSTLKVYVAAIAASHAPIAGQSIGRNNLVIRFLKGSRRMNPSRPHTIPTWDLSTVLRALKSSPFEPLSDADLKTLTLKSALLLALVSVKRIGDLQALSISPSCLEFGPGDSKVILKPRHGYVPKVPSTPFRAQVVTLSALPSSEGDQELSLLCPVRALRMYVERSAPFRKSDQLFVCFGGRNKGQPVTKQRLSRWIVDAISLAYSSLGLECPVGVRAHSTRGVASSWAWSSGVSMAEICAAAGWASPSTFTRFYSLDIPALQAGILSA